MPAAHQVSAVLDDMKDDNLQVSSPGHVGRVPAAGPALVPREAGHADGEAEDRDRRYDGRGLPPAIATASISSPYAAR